MVSSILPYLRCGLRHRLPLWLPAFKSWGVQPPPTPIMERLSRLIKRLPENDFDELYDSIASSNADKSAAVLKMARDKYLSDREVIDVLGIKPNAFYTLKSRLNQKIESFLSGKMESPKMELIKKVGYVSDLVFNNSREITFVMLRKLEKELLDYDLPYELIKIYKSFKKFHINNSEEHYRYSQLYNKHIAYTLAVDKAEDLVGDYFKAYRLYYLSRDPLDLDRVDLTRKELYNVCNLYESHRLKIYRSIIKVWHILFVPIIDEHETESIEDVEDTLNEVQTIFDKYESDTFYHHIAIVFEFLRFEFYQRLGLTKREEQAYELVNSQQDIFISYYGFYIFSARFLSSKLARYYRLGIEKELWDELQAQQVTFDLDKSDEAGFISYQIFYATAAYLAGKFDDARRTLVALRNEFSFKRYGHMDLEIKLLLALQHHHLDDRDLALQMIKSAQRQVRANSSDDEGGEYASAKLLIKLLYKRVNSAEPIPPARAQALLTSFQQANTGPQAILENLRFDRGFLQMLST